MDWSYISGFFDADGSISLVKKNQNNNTNKSIQISFHNTQLSILEEIKNFIDMDLNIKGFISTKKAKKENHSISYDLKYVQYKGYLISRKIESSHPKKKRKIEIYNNIQALTPRNGKYNEKMLNQRNKLVEEFFK